MSRRVYHIRDFHFGISGRDPILKRSCRPETQSCCVRVVIIEKLDRLARDLMVQETIIADLRKHA